MDDKNNYGLIIAIGLDNYLAVACLNKLKPKCVAFIVTDKTVELLPEILNNIDYKIKEYRKFFIKDLTSLTEVSNEYFNAYYWLTQEKNIKNIKVDATNTLTTIAFPVYFGASFIEIFKDLIKEDADIDLIFTTCDFKVINSGKYAAGEPIIGTEKLIELENPMNSIGFVLGVIASELHNEGFYARSEKVFKTLSKNTRGYQHILYSGLASITMACDLWDKFDIKEAKLELEKSILILSKLSKFDYINQLIKVLKNQMKVLSRLEQNDDVEKIIDIFENGNRKMESEQYDDAVARYYRCLDMVSAFELDKYHINTTSPDFSKLPEKVVEKYKNLRDGELPNKYKDGVGGLGLRDSFLLLSCLDNHLGIEYKKSESKFIGMLTLRNQSILAHGTAPIGEKSAQKFKELLELFLTKLLEKEGSELNEIVKCHKFLDLPVNIKRLFNLKRSY